MRKHARETIRRPREIETSYDWDLDEKTMPKKVARKPKDDDFDDEDLFESEEEELQISSIACSITLFLFSGGVFFKEDRMLLLHVRTLPELAPFFQGCGAVPGLMH